MNRENLTDEELATNYNYAWLDAAFAAAAYTSYADVADDVADAEFWLSEYFMQTGENRAGPGYDQSPQPIRPKFAVD